MMDVEKVIKGLECCASMDVNACDKCPYIGCSPDRYCFGNMAADALALLKAQEAVVMAGAELTDAELIEEIRKAPLILKPAVDAAPVVHGNWIECYERSRHYYCSNCGKIQGIASIVMKYCPECGAKMAEHPWAGRYADQSAAEYADNPTV